MFKRLYYTIILLFALNGTSMASHYMGGEIWWECQPDGRYVFYLRAYQECAGILYSFNEQLQSTIPGFANIPLIFLDTNDISPVCFNNPTFPHITCALIAQSGQSNAGGVREWLFKTAPLLLPAGPPPATGWVISFTGCCRNPCQNIVGSSGMDWYLRAIMYPYPATTYNTCWDNSPVFVEKPSTVICAGYPFSYNPNAYDKELDSLAYEWAQPWTANNTPILPGSYYPGYSYNSPLPGPTHNPNNIPATVNPHTGEISFLSYTSGAFVTVNKVSAFKCGIKIAEIFREMQVVLLPCSGNDPPVVIIQYPNGDTLNNYVDTVFAGALVQYSMWAYDGQMLNDTFTPQNIRVTATGLQLGTSGISTTDGCLNPPCAQLYGGDAINPIPLPVNGVWALNTQFRWQTDCSHLETETGCGGVSNIYNFVVKTTDDYCPAPAIKWTTITIIVKNAIMLPPHPKCITTESNGNIKLQWTLPDTSEIPNTWNAYLIYRANNPNGPYTLIDSLKVENNYNFYSTNWTDLTADGNNNQYWYYMVTRSGCYGDYFSANSDTITNILLDVQNLGGGLAHTEWNAPHVPLFPTSTGWYKVYRQQGLSWTLLDSTQTLSLESEVTGCGYINFMVGIADSTGCWSFSNIDSALFQAATPPDLRCVAVEENGTVTLTYLSPGDSTAQYFSAFLIYGSNNPNGPYSLVDSVTNPSMLSKNVHAVNGNPNPVYLYMINRIYCDGFFYSGESDTLKTIHLAITGIDDNHASLNWNQIHTPPLPSTGTIYDLYRNYPAGTWPILVQTPLLSAVDSLIICDDSIPYRVEIPDNSGCFSVSNLSKARYRDVIQPPIPVLDSVSIDSVTGFTHISWEPVSGETQGYIVFYDDHGNWTNIDTVWGGNSSHYLDRKTAGHGCDFPKTYLVISFDSCWNTSQMPVSDAHNTLHFEIYDIDPCEDKITLHWNDYHNMKPDLGGYRIYASENYGPPVLLGTNLSPAPGMPAQTSFIHSNFTQNAWYCYYVQAFNIDNDITSTSCQDCILAVKPRQPQFLYLRNVSVEDHDAIRLKLHVDTTAFVTEYRIYRSPEKAGLYELITKIQHTGEDEIEYLDEDVNTMTTSYYYIASVIDTCKLEVMKSDTSRSILLAVESNEDFTNTLFWNDYEGWTWSKVRGYNIYRGIDDLSDPIPIATVPYGTMTYDDDVSGYFETQGRFRYYVEAIEAPGGTLPFVDTSYSNRARDVQPSKIFIPNAFSPKGYNSIFRPISIYADKTNYQFMIYNRWGQLLFETKDPSEGWDGTFEGNYVPVGVYIYYVRFNTSEGQKYEKRSTVTVVK